MRNIIGVTKEEAWAQDQAELAALRAELEAMTRLRMIERDRAEEAERKLAVAVFDRDSYKRGMETASMRLATAERNALKRAKAACAKVNWESGGEQYNMFGHNLAKQCADAICALMKEGGE